MVEPVAVIFAGGRGTRLWPLSRADAPTQFLPLANDVSFGCSSTPSNDDSRPERRVRSSEEWRYGLDR